MTTTETATPKTWTSVRPMPDISTVHGVGMWTYAETVTRQLLPATDTWDGGHYVITDPRSNYWVVVMCVGFGSTYVIEGGPDGVTSARYSLYYPFEAAEAARQTIAFDVFRDAHRAGTSGQYWKAPEPTQLQNYKSPVIADLAKHIGQDPVAAWMLADAIVSHYDQGKDISTIVRLISPAGSPAEHWTEVVVHVLNVAQLRVLPRS